MKPFLLLREALATSWAAKVPSALVTLLIAITCASTLATVGRTAAAEEQLAARLDSAGSRLLVVANAHDNALISPTVVDQVTGLSTTERAVGTLMPVDVTNGVVGQGATRVPAWGVHGDLSFIATLTSGRWPGPGESIVTGEAMAKLGLDAPVGWVAQASPTTMSDWSVVGSFTPKEPFGDYGTGMLYVAPEGRALDAVHAVLTDAELAQTAQAQVLRIIAPPSPDAVIITSPVSLAELQARVTGDLAVFGRALLVGVLSGGAMLVAVVALADVLVRRKDLGRRRALGATRSGILALVILRTLAPAIVGAALGVTAGLAITNRYGAMPPWSFTTGTVVLALLAAVAAAVPPAVYAATRDPVRVLRTP